MRRTLSQIAMLALLATVSCQVADLDTIKQDEGQTMTIEATLEDWDAPDTKTARQDNGDVWWTPGDAISLFFGNADKVGGNKFTSDIEEPAAVSSFTGTIGAATGGGEGLSVDDFCFWAVYPYDETVVCDGKSVTLPLPSEQASAEGTFAKGQWPTVAKSPGLLFSFKNIVAGYKFKVETEGIDKVVIRTADAAHPIAGRLKVTMSAAGLPVISEVTDASNEVVVTPENGGTFKTNTYYYASVIYGNFGGGVWFDFYKGDTKATYEGVVSGDKVDYPSGRGKFKVMDNKDHGLQWVSTKPQQIVTFDFSDQGYASPTEMSNVAINSDLKVTFAKGTSGTTPKYYSSGASVRAYGGNTITVASDSAPITAISFVFGSSDGSNAITANVGTWVTPEWTGEAQTVKFTIGGSSGHRRIQKIIITYGTGSGGGGESGDDPTVLTDAASAINQSSAVLSGSYGGASQIPGEVGFYWSTTSGVDNTDNELYVDMGTGSSGSFSATLSSLSPSTTYYYCAYVMIGGDYFYGPEMSFTTAASASGNQMAFGDSWLAHYEMPATTVPVTSGLVTYDTYSETYGSSKAYTFNTASSNQRVVTHTFEYNSKTVCNYSMLYDKTYKCALWEAWELETTDHPDKGVGRNNGWAYDPALPADWQPNLSSSYSGYSRGHQVASNDRQTTTAMNKQTFYYSNMTPQLQTLNGATWGQLENAVQGMLTQLGTTKKVYVVTGPIFESGYKTTTDASSVSCPVPTKYYKCVLRLTFDTSGNITKAEGAGFWFHHTSSSDFSRHTVTIDEIETMTGFDFYANIPDSWETSAESTLTNFF